MRNRTVTYGLLGLILILFMLYFIIQGIGHPSGQPIADQLNYIVECAENSRWTEAEETVDRLLQSWDRVKHLLAINYSEADYSLFIDNLARLRGAVRTQDDTETVSLAFSTLNLWKNFLRVVPEP